MKSWNRTGKSWLALAALLLATTGASPSWGAALNTKGETSCHSALTKAISKEAASISKAMAACLDAVLAGDIVGPCPDATAAEAIAKAEAKAAKLANKKCQSTCSISAASCINTPLCPPKPESPESCTGGGKNYFESTNMGFPGAYCESILGHSMTDPVDFGDCANGLASTLSTEVLDNLYGSLASPPSEDGADCLAGLVKAAGKAVSSMAKAVGKCRDTQLSDENGGSILPNNCPTDDLKTAESLAASIAKFNETVDACTPAAILELDLCGNGVGGTADAAAAKTCLDDVLNEAAFSVENTEDKNFAPISVINAAYPATAAARCGDNLVNQKANQFLRNGEECDGTDDGDCPGLCLPAGDIFECTCSDIRRSRDFADGFAADLDNGWSGKAHNAKVTDRAGFVGDLSNCNCSAFDPVDTATCTGVTTDQVCDVFSEVKPRCSNHIGDATSCDEVGNQNNAHTDSDCAACDIYSVNAGGYCTGDPRYCIDGADDGQRCNQEADCTGGSCGGAGVCLDGAFAGDGCNIAAAATSCGICLVPASNAGSPCNINAHCPGGTCEPHTCAANSCIGGANEGDPCTNGGHCPGGRCAVTTDCVSQCYPDAGGPPTGLCASQDDCAEGERCRGICESNPCVKIRNGAPLPLSANGTSVCVDGQFFTNITGTRDIVTGSHAVNYDLRSVTYLAGNNELNPRPCPVCGGFCGSVPGATSGNQKNNSILCDGTCTAGPLQCRVGPSKGATCTTNADCGGYLCTGERCRFDTDCAMGTCSDAASPECAGTVASEGSGDCRLDLACGGGTTFGQPCRIESNTAFGTTSADCYPSGSNISGSGLAISWTPLTSEPITLEAPAACDALGFQNYDCNCVTGGGGTRNQPNDCAPACDAAGPNYGRECSSFTVCSSGFETGVACDEDSDCSGGGLCDGNPKVCGTGSSGLCSIRRCSGGSADLEVCNQDSSCPGGTCPAAALCTIGGGAPNGPCSEGSCNPDDCVVALDCDGGATCDNACPSGRCTPLCTARGICNGGDRDGKFCAIDADCVGGGTCVPDDPEEGACAQGNFEHCDGPGWGFISCSPLQVDTEAGCEGGVNGITGDADDNVGAGYCRADINNCFVNDGAAEGGDTINGNGDPTHTLSVAAYCIPASTSSAVNTTAGLPGAGRIRQPALVVPNFTVLP